MPEDYYRLTDFSYRIIEKQLNKLDAVAEKLNRWLDREHEPTDGEIETLRNQVDHIWNSIGNALRTAR